MRSLMLALVALVVMSSAAIAAPIHDAAKAGDVAAVRELLAAGAAVDARDKDGATPLHVAAIDGNAAVVKVLLDAGADGSLKDKDGKTSFGLADEKLKETDPDIYWRLNDAQYK